VPSDFDLHVFGLNLSAVPDPQRAVMAPSRTDVARVLEALAHGYPEVEAVVVRARNHVEAFVVAPAGSDVVRSWISLLLRFRPDLLRRSHRQLHYHLSGPTAQVHLFRVVCGRYAQPESRESVSAGVKASLALAARCGTLGETLENLFLSGLSYGAAGQGPAGDEAPPA
jgi:glutamyl-tRNA reductase